MLYIMRHGQTDWNKVHRLQGSTDIPLNDEGRRMALEAGKKYKDLHIDVCYCSPLKRAQETAGEESVFEHPELQAYKLFKDPVNYIPPENAESFEELYDRTGQFMDEVIRPELSKGRDVLIVGHGAMNGSIIGRVRNTPLERFWDNLGGNCELTKLI